MPDAVVKTDLGQIRGRVDGGIASFLGMPFAAVPDGPLRFRPPAPATGWDGVRDAVAYGAAPPQQPASPGAPAIWKPADGLDCLNLNVWTPDPGGAGLPVMVWLYGGAFKLGSAAMPQYDGATLAGSGVVVVTLNYRLGFEGFGHLPGVPDNRGLRDQIAALEWVQRNIAAFGGDPGNVTLFGQSAGAASAMQLMSAPATEGLIGRVIAQSIPRGIRSGAEAEQVTGIVAEAAGVAPTWEGFATLPPEAILAVQDAPLRGGNAGPSAFGPVVDGELVTGPPWASPAPDIDLVCGFTQDEYNFFTQGRDMSGADLTAAAASFGLSREAAAAYPDGAFVEMMSDALIRMPTTWTAEAHARAGGRTWLYDFAWRGPTLGACHGIDAPFTFGNGDNRWAAMFLGSPPPADFAALSEQIRTALTSFAATGDPGWPRFDLDRRRTRIWDTTPTDADYPLPESYRIWQSVSP